MRALERLHASRVFPRRTRILADLVAPLVPADATVLDVGCGDGTIAAEVMARRRDVRIRGVDVLVRESTRIPVEWFDGLTLPCAEGSFDAVLLVDVLHHASRPERLLAEAARVARSRVIVKDHVRKGLLAEATLEFMDRIGNARYGVALPFHFLDEDEWRRLIGSAGLVIGSWRSDLRLYPWPADLVFGRRLHVLASLIKSNG